MSGDCPELPDLDSALADLPWSDVKRMALHLHHSLTLSILDQIQEDRSRTAERRIYSMELWLKNDLEASWATLVAALRKIGQNYLAAQLELQYCAALPTQGDKDMPSMPLPNSEEPSVPCHSSVDHDSPLSSHSTDNALTATGGELVVVTAEPGSTREEDLIVDEVAKVIEGSSRLEEYFVSVITHVQLFFGEKETESCKFLNKFRITLINLPMSRKYKHLLFLKEEKEQIKAAEDVSEIFEILRPYWSHVDYGLLERIVMELGDSALKQEIREFISNLIQFEKETSIQNYVDATSDDREMPPEFSEIIIKIGKKASKCTLYDVRQFKESLASKSCLSAYSIYLKKVGSGSVVITLAIPSDVISIMIKAAEDPEFRTAHSVTNVSVNINHRGNDTADRCSADDKSQTNHPEETPLHSGVQMAVSEGYVTSNPWVIPHDSPNSHHPHHHNPHQYHSGVQMAVSEGYHALKMPHYLPEFDYLHVSTNLTSASSRSSVDSGHFSVSIDDASHVSQRSSIESVGYASPIMSGRRSPLLSGGSQSPNWSARRPMLGSSSMQSQQSFDYQDITIDKSKSLGQGSYGTVYQAKCDQLSCAAKVMHQALFSHKDPGASLSLEKFRQECYLLSMTRHPNIVQYLTTSFDRETMQPVLLMELCEGNLTGLLERSPGPLPYHTQLNIAHDIALAIVYLHSNGLYHRDLSSNNILLDHGRAKVTDFGMSKLAGIQVQHGTLCPGNVLYMPPEALDEPPTYTDKLDIFSFGVLLVQVLIRKFPSPANRFTVTRVQASQQFPKGIAHIPVPETTRRQDHLRLIDNAHPLKAIALKCLSDSDKDRPTSSDLSLSLSSLKATPEYARSLREETEERRNRTCPTEELDRRHRDYEEELQRQLRSRDEHLEQAKVQLQNLADTRDQVEPLKLQLKGQRMLTEYANQKLEDNRKEMEKKNLELNDSQELVAQFQKTLNEGEKETKKERMEFQQILKDKQQRKQHRNDLGGW